MGVLAFAALFLVDAGEFGLFDGGHFEGLQVGREASDEVMRAVRVPVIDVDLERPIVVVVAQISHAQAERLPGGIQRVFDHLALVHHHKLAGGGGFADDEKRVAFAEEILFVELRGGELHSHHLLAHLQLLGVDENLALASHGSVSENGGEKLATRHNRAQSGFHSAQKVVMIQPEKKDDSSLL